MAKLRIKVWKQPYCGVEREIKTITEEFLAILTSMGLRPKREPVNPNEFQYRGVGRVVCEVSDAEETGKAMQAVMGIAERHGVRFTETNLERFGPAWMKAAKCYDGPVITAELYRKECTL